MLRQQSLSYSGGQAEKKRLSPSDHSFMPGIGLATSLVVLAVIWKLVVVIHNYPAFVLPAPDQVLARLVSEWVSGTLPHHTLLTFVEALSGFGIALVVSLVLGYLLAHAPRLEQILAPQLAAT